MLAVLAIAAVLHFLTPQGANHATCDMSSDDVTCLIEPPQTPLLDAIRVTMTPNGRLAMCHGLRCIVGATERAPTLAFGRSRATGGFRCTSMRRGVRCVVVASGKGFLLTAHGVQRIQP